MAFTQPDDTLEHLEFICNYNFVLFFFLSLHLLPGKTLAFL